MRARLERFLRDDLPSLLRCQRAAVYLRGLLGGPRLLATTGPFRDEAAPLDGPNHLRVAARRAGLALARVRFDDGEALVVPIARGSLVLFRPEPWSDGETQVGLALGRLVDRALAFPGAPIV